MAAKRPSADERARQAEMDAARAREIAEEQESRRARRGSDALVALRALDAQNTIKARVVREFVRTVMIESVVKRLYDIGMGVETFDVPTMAGNVVSVPASPATQVKALAELANIGIPHQLGLIDDDGNTLPGAIVLGELELRAAQHAALGARMAGAARAFSGEAGEMAAERSETSPLTPAMTERVQRGEFEIVEVEEGGRDLRVNDDQPPPPIEAGAMTPEQRILARRRARRSPSGNGAPNGNGAVK